MPTLTIDSKKCIGCQTCTQIYPDTFIFDQKTQKAVVKNPKITDKNKASVDICPVSAISIKK